MMPTIGDLAEAALHAGRISQARARVKQVEAASGHVPGTCIAVGLLHAHALLAQDPEEAAGRFDEALAADLTHWPLQRARLLLAHGRRPLLAHGQWLRRQRRIAESRIPLRDARDAFDAMGCAAWGDSSMTIAAPWPGASTWSNSRTTCGTSSVRSRLASERNASRKPGATTASTSGRTLMSSVMRSGAGQGAIRADPDRRRAPTAAALKHEDSHRRHRRRRTGGRRPPGPVR